MKYEPPQEDYITLTAIKVIRSGQLEKLFRQNSCMPFLQRQNVVK